MTTVTVEPITMAPMKPTVLHNAIRKDEAFRPGRRYAAFSPYLPALPDIINSLNLPPLVDYAGLLDVLSAFARYLRRQPIDWENVPGYKGAGWRFLQIADELEKDRRDLPGYLRRIGRTEREHMLSDDVGMIGPVRELYLAGRLTWPVLLRLQPGALILDIRPRPRG